ncbi:hypothetical protein BG011_010238 [Mortierella polycephala]|uniref:Uncharacterized protein n=1 Tax=Mortierella polycephala TaxID=41804 RepID=A0A9P6PKZ9_9FUNG|nr:hypothetical protein BG011_010238 [Mortierella polycephala]
MPSPAEHHYGHMDPRKSSIVQGPSGTGHMKPRAVKNSVNSKDSEPIRSRDPYSRGGQGSDQRTLSSLRLSHHSQLDLPSLLQNECEGVPLRRYDVNCGRDETNIDLAAKEEDDELPLGLLQVNRHSRWFNTQLSTDDGASETQNDSHANIGIVQHTLLPPEPITPKHGPVPDTSPYTKNSVSNSNHPSPPARPTRPPGDLLSTLDGPNDSASWMVPFANARSSSSSPAPSPATYKLRQPHQPSHSGPISAMSNVSQVRAYHSTSPFSNLSGDIKQTHGRNNVEGEQDEEDEDEPLAVTQSRQQSAQFLQRLQYPFSHSRMNPLRPSSFAAFGNNRSSAGLMTKSYSSRPLTHEQATPPASNESASYF